MGLTQHIVTGGYSSHLTTEVTQISEI